MCMQASQYAEVYRVLDGLKSTGVVYPGAPGVLFAAIDQLRLANAPDEHIRLAEDVSVAIVRLEGAVRNGQRDRAAEIRAEIGHLSAEWMDTPIIVAA